MYNRYEHVKHPWGALFDKNSEILILGSFPSPKSRENGFFYGHPQNRFWKVITAVFMESLPVSIDEKKALLKRNHVALWDVIEECDIVGASDSSVKNAIPANISDMIPLTNVSTIFCNGSKSYELYCKYQYKEVGIKAVKLPSTSPANASCSLDYLTTVWKKAFAEREKNIL